MNTTRCNIEYFKVRFSLKQTVNNRPNRRHAATAHGAIFGADPHLFSWKRLFYSAIPNSIQNPDCVKARLSR